LFSAESGEIIKNGLSRKTGAQTLNNLTDILDTVDEVRQNVVLVEKTSKSLKDKVERLKTGLTDSKDRLVSLLDQCPSRKCAELRNMPEIRSLRVQNEFQNVCYPLCGHFLKIIYEIRQNRWVTIGCV
jgi:hypothetical protein